jgi:paraquat-inducible protein B
MSEHAPAELPRAKIRKKSRFSAIWIIPLAAAVAAIWLIWASLEKSGPVITIVFNDGGGLQPNQTVLKYRGVRAGSVRSVELAKDMQHVIVQVRLLRFAAGLARGGSEFWVVRPEVSSAGLHGLETIVSGPYIEAQPGNGPPQKRFVGAESAPIDENLQGKYEVVVTTPQISTLSVGAPVYYRGIEVGSVAYFMLGANAQSINIHLYIETNFAPLVCLGSRFWNAGGISFRLHFLGLNVSAENFRSLIAGGVAFATPTETGPPAPSGTVFPLYEKPDNEWLKWSPAIPITADQKPGGNSSPAVLLNNVDDADK